MKIVNKKTGDSLTAVEFNQIPYEIQNAITNAEINPSASNLTQLSQSMTQMACSASYFLTSGTETAITLSASNPRLAPAKLTDGMMVRFRAIYDNTLGVTVNLANLGAKPITSEGEPIKGSEIKAGASVILFYNQSSDSYELFKSGGLGGGGLEICDIGMSLFVDESKGLRRYLNGTIMEININTQPFLNRLKEIVELYPSLRCNETEWQQIASNSVHGQCGKFVIDEDNGTIRLPRIVMPIQGLTDLSKLGELVEQALPQHSHDYEDYYSSGGQGHGDQTPLVFETTISVTRTSEGASNSIYQENANVQQEQIQYPYFIQIATGQETEVDITNEIQLNNPFSLFDSKYSDHELNNLSWLISNRQYNSGTVYVGAYEKLVRIYNGTETVEGISVKAIGDDTITDYDFVIDIANQQFRLPLLDGSEDLVGDRYEELEFENQKTYIAPANGWYELNANYVNGISVCVYMVNTTNGLETRHDYYENWGQARLKLEVKKGDLILAGTNGTVSSEVFRFVYAQGNGNLYYYVGETTQNANLINAGRIQEQLANKEDIDTWVYFQEGTSGYRYNKRNGYCEQWGYTNKGGTNVITLLKEYVDANYNITIAQSNSSDYYLQASPAINYNAKSADKFNLYVLDITACYWRTSGYLKEGEY